MKLILFFLVLANSYQFTTAMTPQEPKVDENTKTNNSDFFIKIPKLETHNQEFSKKTSVRGKEKVDVVMAPNETDDFMWLEKSVDENKPLDKERIVQLQHKIEQHQIASRSSNNAQGKKFVLQLKILDDEYVNLLINSADDNLRHTVENLKNLVSGNLEPEKEQIMRIAVPKRILFKGPPGVGKSDLAIAIAQYCNIIFVFESAASLVTEYKNSGITRLDELFDPLIACKQFIIIILDELTGLTARHAKENNPDPGVIEHLLGKLDICSRSGNVIVLATVNDPTKIPDALYDRFIQCIIDIKKPDQKLCIDILLYTIRKISTLTEIDLKQKKSFLHSSIAGKMVGLSSREIAQAVVPAAAANAIKNNRYNITLEDLDFAIEWVYKNRKSSL